MTGTARKSMPIMFSAAPTQGVDRENGVIKGIVIVEEGEDKVGDNMDNVFLESLVRMGNNYPNGLKARFGHPNMCDSALGTYIGRYKNFRIDTVNEAFMGDPKGQISVVKADLHMDEIAKTSPKGDLYSYCLDMAEKNADMFGNSIVFREDEPEVYDVVKEDGSKVPTTFIRCKSFIASDLVDSPAATTDLFRSENDFALLSTEFLDENPAIFEIIGKNPEVIKSFLTKYAINKNINMEHTFKSRLDAALEFFTGKKEDPAIAPEPTTATSVVTEQGTLYCNGEVEAGKVVYTDPEMTTPCTAGNYSSETGDYVIGEGGVVTSTPIAPVPEPQPNVEMEALKSDFNAQKELYDSLIAKHEALEQDMEKAVQALESSKSQIEALTEKVNLTEEEIRETIKSEFTPEGSRRSDKTQNPTEQKPGGKFAPEGDRAKQALVKTGTDVSILEQPEN